MDFLLDFILHVDQYMIDIVQEYHTWAYVILFLIIFCETGLVVTPFLPGDSLLFVAGGHCCTTRYACRGECAGLNFICCCCFGGFLQLYDRVFLWAEAVP